MFDVYGWGKIFIYVIFVFNDCEYYVCINDIDYIWINVFILVILRFILFFIKFKLFEEIYMYLKIVYENVFLVLLKLDFLSF